jgi:hypothetical protein
MDTHAHPVPDPTARHKATDEATAAALEPLAAAVREQRVQHDAEVRAASLREAADRILAHPGPHTDALQPDAPGFWWDTRDRDAATVLLLQWAGESSPSPAAEPPVAGTPLAADPWQTIARLTTWLDTHNGRTTAETALRILKVTEEAGEVASAWIGATGQNPRKGFTHPTADVADELCDVITAAMVALTTIITDPRGHFAGKVARIAALRLDDLEAVGEAPAKGSRMLRRLVDDVAAQLHDEDPVAYHGDGGPEDCRRCVAKAAGVEL